MSRPLHAKQHDGGPRRPESAAHADVVLDAQGPGSWLTELPPPYRQVGRVRLLGSKVLVDVPSGRDLGGQPAGISQTLWGLLRCNSLLSADWKFVLLDSEGVLHLTLRGERFIESGGDVRGTVAKLLGGLSEPWRRLHSPPSDEREPSTTGDVPSAADLEGIRELVETCRSLGWDTEPGGAAYATVHSRVRGRPVQFRLAETTNSGSRGVSLSHFPPAVQVENLPLAAQIATGLCLLQLGAVLCGVRGSGRKLDGSTHMCLEARDELPAGPEALDRVLRGLGTACEQVGRELGFLCSESIATRYLSVRGLRLF